MSARLQLDESMSQVPLLILFFSTKKLQVASFRVSQQSLLTCLALDLKPHQLHNTSTSCNKG